MAGYITANGSVLAAHEVGAQYETLPAGVKLEEFAVNVLGFAWFEAFPFGYRINLRPDRVAPPTESALYLMLADGPIDRVLVTLQSDDGLQSRIYGSSAEAIAGIGRALAQARQKHGPRFAKQTAEMGSLEKYPSLERLFACYRAGGRTLARSGLEAMVSQTAQGRFLIVARDDDGALRIQTIGSGYRGFDATWCSRSRGARIEDQPDLAYGSWLGEDYRSALAAQDPRLEVVDAVIFRPRLGRWRFGYRRLILPFVDPAGGDYLLSASVIDPSVDLGID